MKMTPEQFEQYRKSTPDVKSQLVRKWFKVPEDKYYTVSMWPDHVAGVVRVDHKRHRDAKSKKISKSDSQA